MMGTYFTLDIPSLMWHTATTVKAIPHVFSTSFPHQLCSPVEVVVVFIPVDYFMKLVIVEFNGEMSQWPQSLERWFYIRLLSTNLNQGPFVFFVLLLTLEKQGLKTQSMQRWSCIFMIVWRPPFSSRPRTLPYPTAVSVTFPVDCSENFGFHSQTRHLIFS